MLLFDIAVKAGIKLPSNTVFADFDEVWDKNVWSDERCFSLTASDDLQFYDTLPILLDVSHVNGSKVVLWWCGKFIDVQSLSTQQLMLVNQAVIYWWSERGVLLDVVRRTYSSGEGEFVCSLIENFLFAGSLEKPRIGSQKHKLLQATSLTIARFVKRGMFLFED